MTHDELLTALREAKEPSRELDRDIALIAGWRYEGPPRESGPYLWVAPDGRRDAVPPWFTTSLDAALTLVPTGWSEEIKRTKNRRRWRVNLWLDAFDHRQDRIQSADAPTGALALCIAAILARYQEEGR